MRALMKSLSIGVLCFGTSACVFEDGRVTSGAMGGADSTIEEMGQELYAAMDPLWLPDKRSGTTTLGVCFENYDSKLSTEYGWVASALTSSWEAASNVNFTGFGACTSSSKIRVSVSDEGPHTSGLGTAYGKVVLNFTFKNFSCSGTRESCIRYAAIHEIGHALAFSHEQNRADTPTWCKEAFPPQGSNGAVYWIWDPYSVMNYCGPRLPQLSTGDKDGVARLYGNTGFNMVSGSGYWLRWQDGTFGRISSGKNGGTSFGAGFFGVNQAQPFAIKRVTGSGTLTYKSRVTVGAAGWFLSHGVPIRGTPTPYFEVSKTAGEWEILDPRNLASTGAIGVNQPFVLKVPGKTLYLGMPQKGDFLNGFGLVATLDDRVDWRGLGPR